MSAQGTGRRRLYAVTAIVVTLLAAVTLALVPLVLPGPDDQSRESPAARGDEPADRTAATRSPGESGTVSTPDVPRGPTGPPNVVLVVMDDFSMELLRTMPNVVALQQDAATYTNSFVVNSLCCPSRAATFTGLPPHLNGVLSNTSGGPLGALGGYPAFEANDDEERSYNVAVQQAGYRTGFIGKYLNEYEPRLVAPGVRSAPPLISGWDDFAAVSGGAYQGWGFYKTERDGDELELEEFPRPDRSEVSRKVADKTYAGQVIADEALRLLRRYERRDARADDRAREDAEPETQGGKPWLLHVAPYGTHGRTQPSYPREPYFPPALRDRPSTKNPDGNCGLVECASLSVTDLPGYADPGDDNVPYRLDDDGVATEAESWRTQPFTLTAEKGTFQYVDRARMAQSIDRMIGRMVEQLGPALEDDTYLVVTSDNGFHLGQYSLNGGKGLPYDSDSRVPLVVAGPGVVPGERSQFVSNVDVAPTIEAMTGARRTDPQAGVSFAETFGRPEAPGGRYIFQEHTYGPVLPGEPDADIGSGSRLDIIPSYVAVRSAEGLLVRVDLDRSFTGEDFAWELYRYDRPWEDVNVFDTDHDLPYARDLRRRLEAYADCEPKRCRRLTR